MEIGLIRVDSRLIHGQVITKWLNYSKANVIAFFPTPLGNPPS